MLKLVALLLPLVLASCQCSKSKALESPQLSTQNGDAEAQYNEGLKFAAGDLDLKKAFEWFLKAAENGNLRAQVEIAKRYNSGVGVEQDESKAIEWFTKAAEKGNVDAQRGLGVMYWMGASAPRRDLKKAEIWFEKAIAQGDEQAKKMLQEMKSEKPKAELEPGEEAPAPAKE